MEKRTTMKTNLEKLNSIVEKDAKETREWIGKRNKGRKARRASQKIALHIRKRLEELRWRQKDLAEKMQVKPQQVNKWVSGKENFRLDTIMRLSEVLNVELINIKSFSQEIKTTEVADVINDYDETAKIVRLPIRTEATKAGEYNQQEVMGHYYG